MGHLTLEVLARLVDDEPTPEEREHLTSCLHCAAELGGLRDQTEALGALPDVRPPQGEWDVLEARLVSEGIIERRRLPLRGLAGTPGWVQAAAGLVLFLGGVGLGSARAATEPDEPAMTSLDELMPVASSVQPATLAQAEDAVRMAEREYMEALVQYRQMQAAGQPNEQDGVDPASRFAALEALVATTRAAVREAPADPFLNGVLVSAMAEREAALRRVASNPEWY